MHQCKPYHVWWHCRCNTFQCYPLFFLPSWVLCVYPGCCWNGVIDSWGLIKCYLNCSGYHSCSFDSSGIFLPFIFLDNPLQLHFEICHLHLLILRSRTLCYYLAKSKTSRYISGYLQKSSFAHFKSHMTKKRNKWSQYQDISISQPSFCYTIKDNNLQ